MVDVFFMRPNHAEGRRMKSRLSAKPGLSLQFVESASDVAKLNPRPGSIFIFHVSSAADLSDLLSQIETLMKKSETTTISVVISDLKDLKSKSMIEKLPQTIFYAGDRAAHDLDILMLKLIKEQSKVTKERRQDTLTYVRQDETFITKDRSSKMIVTSETQVEPAKAGTTNVFQPITDGTQKKLLISDAVDSQAAVAISNFGAKDEIKGFLFGLDRQRDTVFCEVKGTPAEVAAFRAQSDISKKMAMSCALQQSRVFWVCMNFKWVKESTLEVSVPSLIYSVQRRRDFRLLCYPKGMQRLTFFEESFKQTYVVYDLSIGGVSLLVAPAEAARLEVTTKNAGQLEIDGEFYDVGPMRYRQKQAFNSDSGEDFIKMGFSFERVKGAVKTKIGNYVDRKGRDYFMDYMLESEKAALQKG